MYVSMDIYQIFLLFPSYPGGFNGRAWPAAGTININNVNTCDRTIDQHLAHCYGYNIRCVSIEHCDTKY
jgi:hypothetical protein